MLGEIISREHSYMVRLLVILDEKATQLQNDKEIDYQIVHDVIVYLQQHSQQTHHPKEDLIYHYYLEHYGKNSDIANLDNEHKLLDKVTLEFSELVEMVLQDSIVPKEVFIQQLHHFIHEQKRHLDFEEREILPKLKRDFSAKDWEAVESLWGEEVSDPLFGHDIEEEYLRLSSYMKAD
ncbi:hemerythrin domain-containing protein [Vibrio rumoiensis]|uniref:Cation-binding protein n=1 Tax=Vibrio rumoiensis 1S-45 TaxID=1188252 RepID=A0A1E5DZ79_9VIBR|nr:hemerythrin domain-containing protein [Vibrio rumoiensis]OEF22608.1 cation-binding protein [Vibrio rumoiensis 1S-45]